jgi:hypothetical protein
VKIENIVRAKLRRAIAELRPVLKRRLTEYQLNQVDESFAIASEVFFDNLQDILEGKEPDFVLDALSEDDIESLLEPAIYDYDDAA